MRTEHIFLILRYEGRAKSSVTNRLPWFYPRYILKYCTWMVCWIANDTRLIRANCFPTDRVISNRNRCSYTHWPIYLLHWNMDQKTEIRSYIKCRIRLNIDSKQIFNELCGIYGPQTISIRTVFRWVKDFKAGKFSVEMIPVLEGLKPLLPRLKSLLWRLWSNRMRDCLSKI